MPVPAFLSLVDTWAKQERRKDARVALLSYVIATSFGWKKDGNPIRIEDFMPGEREEHEQSPEEMAAVLMGMAGKEFSD